MIKKLRSNKIVKNTIFTFAALSALSFSACKKEQYTTENNQVVEKRSEPSKKTPIKLKKLSSQTKAYLEGKNIAVILGYGYNDEATVTGLTQILKNNFGVETEENPGLISIFVYPEDFMVSGKQRISSLVDKLEDKNMAGMIILGAPEGLHIALSKLQDKEESGRLSYPVFTMFSQDEVLGSESTSDFVLDYAHKTNSIETEVTDVIPDFDVSEILLSSISAMLELREPLKQDSNLMPFVKKLLNKNRTLTRYVDGETGLQSINHFIFE